MVRVIADVQAKKAIRLPSRSSVANSRVPKSVLSGPSFETGCSTSRSLSSLEQRVDPLQADAAAGGPGDERLGAGSDRPIDSVALPPALVGRLPKVQDGLVAAHDGEAVVLVDHIEAEAFAVEGHRRSHVAHRHRGNRAVETDHALTLTPPRCVALWHGN